MTNIALFCVRSRQGTTSVVPNNLFVLSSRGASAPRDLLFLPSVVLSNSIQVLKGHGFSRAVHAARMFSAAFSSRALRAGGVA